MMIVVHAVPRNDVYLGIVIAENISVDRYPEAFDRMLRTILSVRADGLDGDGESRRVAARHILRNGSYRPTGRGKPANEYLLRAASDPDYRFPRINSPVDVCNYLSVKHIVPISLWDLDLAASDTYVFRLGRSGEGYVFNEGGQRIEVEDLLVGCRVFEEKIPVEEPIINPVRDSLATKTTTETRRVAGCIYAPSSAFSTGALTGLCAEFAALLSACGDRPTVSHGVLLPQTSMEL